MSCAKFRLAFDWQNFRVCGNVGNRKKGTYFPLRPGCARVAAHADVRLVVISHSLAQGA
jgi:hypothetical protein